MMAHRLANIAPRYKIEAFIYLDQHVCIGPQKSVLLWRYRYGIYAVIWFHLVADLPSASPGAVFMSSVSRETLVPSIVPMTLCQSPVYYFLTPFPAFNITINTETSAGLIPEMREACPRFSGLMRDSFSRASIVILVIPW